MTWKMSSDEMLRGGYFDNTHEGRYRMATDEPWTDWQPVAPGGYHTLDKLCKTDPQRWQMRPDAYRVTRPYPHSVNEMVLLPAIAEVRREMGYNRRRKQVDYAKVKVHIRDVIDLYQYWQRSKATPHLVKLVNRPPARPKKLLTAYEI